MNPSHATKPSSPSSMTNRQEAKDYYGRGAARLDNNSLRDGAAYDHDWWSCHAYNHDDEGREEYDPGGGRHSSRRYQDHQRYQYEPPSASSYMASGMHQSSEAFMLPTTTRHQYTEQPRREAVSCRPRTTMKTEPTTRHYNDRNDNTASCFDNSEPRGRYHHQSVHSDIPSLVESENSTSVESSWNEEDDWNSKKSPCEDYYSGYGYAEGGQSAYSKQMACCQERALRNKKTIEISPGEYLRLRGADETWKAIQHDFYMPSKCSCCCTTIFCIQDANFILCPECRVVSPMPGVYYEGSNDGGVGLGFTMEELAQWQKDIERNRKVR